MPPDSCSIADVPPAGVENGAASLTTRQALAVYTERSTLVMMALGFAAGLPFLLIFDTLSAWLRDEGLSLEVIGFFSLATLVYSFKFLWAPLIDRTRVPGLTHWLGHRRSWMLICQMLIIVGLWLVAGRSPTDQLGVMAALAVLVGFCSATQDIAIDAWRIEVVDESRQGAMAAAYQWGYRVATLVAGAVPLLLAESYGWNLSYGVMAGLMSLGVLATLGAPREAQHTVRPTHVEGLPRAPARDGVEWVARLGVLAAGALVVGSGLAASAAALAGTLAWIGMDAFAAGLLAAWQGPTGVWVQVLAVLLGFAIIVVAVSPIPGIRTRPGVYMASALGDPLSNFFSRYGRKAGPILALICLYRLSDFVLNIMNPFYLDLGFTLTEVAEVRKIFGVAALMAGVFSGGYAIARFGLPRALLAGALGGPLSNLVFVWLATQGHALGALFVSIGLENVFSGFAGTCLIAYMSSLTATGFTATQYALFSSLYALPGRLLASQSGRIVESAARAAESGGTFSLLNPLFAGLPPETFADAFEKSGVSPAALGSGYAVFFIYSCLVGVAAMILAFLVTREDRRQSLLGPMSAVTRAGRPGPTGAHRCE
jgi:PAT family beta-lactamase induction signal transducer AmpG